MPDVNDSARGFNHSVNDLVLLSRIIRICHIIFLVNIIFGLMQNYKETIRLNRAVKWIVDIAVLTTLLPLLYPHPEHPWIPILEKILYSNYYLYSILAAYSAVEISYGVMAAMGKRTNPSLILSASFLLFIFIGSLILMMPKCTVNGISYIDSLFVSTSAVCITGLTTVDVSQTFTPVGLIVIAVMVQVGGLGIMTFTSFFALFFSGNASIYSQLIAKDMIYSKTINALLPTLLYIFGFTIAIEATGAVAFFLCVHNTLGLSVHDEIVFSAFHALSAFCNAGFSNIEGGLSNPLLLRSNQMVYLVASVLIFAGGIGFPILVNFRQAIGSRLKSLRNLLLHGNMGARPAQIYDLNTKVVLVASGWIIAVSTILFFLFEYDNSLAGMPLSHKRYLIIGLGIYGTNLAKDLTDMGHEVIGADSSDLKVDAIKDYISTAYIIDSTDEASLSVLPLKNVDTVIVAIGENFGASVKTVALLRKLGVRNLYARAIDDLHRDILEGMHVKRILTPEQRAAHDLVNELSLGTHVDSLRIDRERFILRFNVPDYFLAMRYKSLFEPDNLFGLRLLAASRPKKAVNTIGIEAREYGPVDLTADETVQSGDVFTCLGTAKEFGTLFKHL